MPVDDRVALLLQAFRTTLPVKAPEWHGEFEGWTVSWLTKHHWKVARTIPFQDALHEAVVVFLRVRRRYPGVEPKHLMALYQTAWKRHFIDLSNADTEDRLVGELPKDAEGEVMELPGAADNDGYLATLVRQAPAEVRMVLSLLVNAPQDLLNSLLPNFTNTDARQHGNGSKRINQLLGLPAEQDTLGMVRKHFE